MFTKTEIELAPKVYEALKKIAEKQGKKWEWEPEIGDWFLLNDYPYVVAGVLWYTIANKVDNEPQPDDAISVVYVKSHTIQTEAHDNVIPLPHWEKLEEIMEGLGYILQGPFKDKSCFVARFGVKGWAEGKSRQEAVMRAIIKLGEEIGKNE